MLETFQSETSRDFRQRYQGSYGYYTVPETNKRLMVYMEEVGDTYTTFVDENRSVYKANVDTGVIFEFIPISKKLFTHNDGLYLVQRKPARQWTRGITSSNTSIEVVGVGNGRALSFEFVEAAFASEPENVLQNVNALENRLRKTVALSNTFGVIGTELYVYAELIGSFIPERKEIVLDTPIFRQELLDLVQRLGIPYKVSNV